MIRLYSLNRLGWCADNPPRVVAGWVAPEGVARFVARLGVAPEPGYRPRLRVAVAHRERRLLIAESLAGDGSRLNRVSLR